MVTKKIKDLEKGDVIRVEFGDYDNWVEVIVKKVVPLDEDFRKCKMYCEYMNGSKVEMYSEANDCVELVGV